MNRLVAHPPPRSAIQRRVFLATACFLLVGGVAGTGAGLMNVAKIKSVGASPAYIVAETHETVTFIARISDATSRRHDPKKVLLLRTDSLGSVTDIVGRMSSGRIRRRGTDGDKVYSLRVSLNEASVGSRYFRVAAFFESREATGGSDDWDRDLAILNNSGERLRRYHLPPLIRRLRRYEVSDLIVVMVDPFPLPADPGDQGTQTLEGVDSDSDGVRDDVQRWIGLTVGRSAAADAALQYARAQQRFLTSNGVDGGSDIERASDCLNHQLGDPIQAYRLKVQLRPMLLNTVARTRAYAGADSLLGGMFSPVSDPATWAEACE